MGRSLSRLVARGALLALVLLLLEGVATAPPASAGAANGEALLRALGAEEYKCNEKVRVWLTTSTAGDKFEIYLVDKDDKLRVSLIRLGIDTPREDVDIALNAICDRITGGSVDASRVGGAGLDLEVHALGDFPVDFIQADLDGSAPLDLVFANEDSDEVSVLLGIPGGSTTASDPSYTDASSYPTGVGPRVVRAGDFDEDLALDLVTANLGSGATGNLSLLLGNGDGSFQAATSISAGPQPRDLVVGRFDADDHLDLVVATGQSQALLLLTGNGDGSFDAPVVITAPGFPSSVEVADFQPDGKLDLVTEQAVLLGNGTGGFGAPLVLPTPDDGTFLRKLIAADLDLDGDADLAAHLGSDRIVLYQSRGDRSFETAVVFDSGANAGARLIAADVDGDALPDLVSTIGQGGGGAAVFLNRSTIPLFRNGFESGGTTHWSSRVGRATGLAATQETR